MPVDSMAQSTFLLHHRSKRWAEFIYIYIYIVLCHASLLFFFKLKNIKSMKIFLVVLLYLMKQFDFDG